MINIPSLQYQLQPARTLLYGTNFNLLNIPSLFCTWGPCMVECWVRSPLI